MKKFIIDILIKPFFAILFFVGFGGFFVYGGFQLLHIKCNKNSEKNVACDISKEHFWGFVKSEFHVEGVNNVEIEKHITRGRWTKRRGRRYTLTTVVINTESRKIPLLEASNVDDKLKRDLIKKMNTYLIDQNETYFDESFSVKNIFGWVGLPFLVIGILGILSWPYSIITYWLKQKYAYLRKN